MRIFAIHDAAGHVAEVVTSPDDLPAPTVTRPGLTMTEIETPDGVADSDFQDEDKVAALFESYRVDITRMKARLVRRE